MISYGAGNCVELPRKNNKDYFQGNAIVMRDTENLHTWESWRNELKNVTEVKLIFFKKLSRYYWMWTGSFYLDSIYLEAFIWAVISVLEN